jgi:hypothetical protein
MRNSTVSEARVIKSSAVSWGSVCVSVRVVCVRMSMCLGVLVHVECSADVERRDDKEEKGRPLHDCLMMMTTRIL